MSNAAPGHGGGDFPQTGSRESPSHEHVPGAAPSSRRQILEAAAQVVVGLIEEENKHGRLQARSVLLRAADAIRGMADKEPEARAGTLREADQAKLANELETKLFQFGQINADSNGVVLSCDLAERILAALRSDQALAGAGIGTWRCFHCDEVFTDERCAREHFGQDEMREAACRIKAGAERSILTALRNAENDATAAWNAVHDEVHLSWPRMEGLFRLQARFHLFAGIARAPSVVVPVVGQPWHALLSDMRADAHREAKWRLSRKT